MYSPKTFSTKSTPSLGKIHVHRFKFDTVHKIDTPIGRVTMTTLCGGLRAQSGDGRGKRTAGRAAVDWREVQRCTASPRRTTSRHARPTRAASHCRVWVTVSTNFGLWTGGGKSEQVCVGRTGLKVRKQSVGVTNPAVLSILL